MSVVLAKLPTTTPTSEPKQNPFDGTWVGKLDQGPMGVNQFTQVVSGSGTIIHETSKYGTFTRNATCDGKAMRWSWKARVLSGNSTFTLNPDGKTAVETYRSGMLGIKPFSSLGTFYKTSEPPPNNANK